MFSTTAAQTTTSPTGMSFLEGNVEHHSLDAELVDAVEGRCGKCGSRKHTAAACTVTGEALPQHPCEPLRLLRTAKLCTVVRDGGYRPHPPGMPSRNLLGDLFLFLPHGVTVHEISPPA